MPLPEELFLEEFPKGRGGLRVAVVYPNSYPVGIASLGYQTILRKLIAIGGCEIRRFFFDPERDGTLFAPDGGKPADADIVLVSVAYELDYFNLVRLLMQSGIPPRRRDRKGLPLVFVGGVAPSTNPLPLSDIADAVHIGDCEDVLPVYFNSLDENIKDLRGPQFKAARDNLLSRWVANEYTFVPGLSTFASLSWAFYEGFPTDPGRSIIISPESVWADTFLVETSRGCDVGCKFCLIGNNQRNCRNASFDSLRELLISIGDCPSARDGGKSTDQSASRGDCPRYSSPANIGLIGSSVGSYPHLVDIVRICVEMGKRVGMSSLNIRNASDELMMLLAKSGEHKVTMAVETGSERLQVDIGKVIPSGLVIDRVKAAYDAGMKSVKLYFIVGLPGETPDDVAESVNLVNDITEQIDLKSLGGKAQLDIGVSCFVPKMGTPWRNQPMASEKELRNRIDLFHNSLSKLPHVSVQAESAEMSIFQGILSVGDESVSELIIQSASKGRGWRAEFRRSARKSGWLERIHEDRRS